MKFDTLLIRPRLTDYHGITLAQEDADFAIPFFDEDVPLYVDPFLMWRSPSMQDNSLHEMLMGAFNHLGKLAQGDGRDAAIDMFECSPVVRGRYRSPD